MLCLLEKIDGLEEGDGGGANVESSDDFDDLGTFFCIGGNGIILEILFNFSVDVLLFIKLF